jgi:hypothetical protein
MRIKDLIKESFDQTYKIFKKSERDFGFTTESGGEYNIHFQTPSGQTNINLAMEYHKTHFDLVPASPQKITEVEFTLDGTYKYLGGKKVVSGVDGNPMKIFATVLNTVFWYVNTNNVDVVFFGGESQLGAVYERLTKRFVPSNFQVASRKIRGETKFMIYKKGMQLE